MQQFSFPTKTALREKNVPPCKYTAKVVIFISLSFFLFFFLFSLFVPIALELFTDDV